MPDWNFGAEEQIRMEERFQLHSDPLDQGWEILVAKASMYPEFLWSYMNETWNVRERTALFALLISAADELPDGPNSAQEAELERAIALDLSVSHDIIYYWARIEDLDVPDCEGFFVTGFLRRMYFKYFSDRLEAPAD
jgi:hypothetical protein